MLSVVLGKTTSIYTNGEHITGDVVIKTISNCNILDLTVNYCGVSFVSFIVSEKEGKARICKKVEETDFHLDVLHPLIKSYRGVGIKSGVHTYPFSLHLPWLLPSSHKGPYGEISYYVHVHLQTSESTIDVRKPIIIVAPVNINLFFTSQVALFCRFRCNLIQGRDVQEYGTRGRHNFRTHHHRTVTFERLPSEFDVKMINRLPEEIKQLNYPKKKHS